MNDSKWFVHYFSFIPPETFENLSFSVFKGYKKSITEKIISSLEVWKSLNQVICACTDTTSDRFEFNIF